METGKRPPPQDNTDTNGTSNPSTEEPPAKRQTISKNGPLTQDDVQLFQKEAIFRQMQAYKREKEIIQTQLDQLEKKSQYHDEHLRLISVWWDQLLNQIKVLVDAEIPSNGIQDTAATDPLPPALSTAQPELFSKHLADKANLIKASLTPLFAIIQSKSKDSPDTQKLKDSIQQLQLNAKLLDAEREKLQDHVSDLDHQLTDITFKYLNAEKRLDRFKSSTLQQIDAGTKHSKSTDNNNSNNNNNNDGPNSNNNNNGSSNNTTANNNNSTDNKNDQKVSKEESEAQNLAAKQALAVSEKRSHEILKLQDKILKLSEQVSSLSTNLLNPSEDQVSNALIFKNLKIQLEAENNKNNQLELQKTELSNENSMLLSERTKFKQDTESEFKHLQETLTEKLTKAEQDLARIRTARDDLVQDVALRKVKEADKISTLKELQELAETRLARIQSLEKETERLQADTESHLSTSTADELAEQTKEELITRICKLQKQNSILSAELPGLEQAFNKAHEQLSQKVFDLVGREDKVNKLGLEKAKADQKYFSAMRAKEVVSMENKALKTQLAKSSEVIEQVRQSENGVNEKLISLERLYADMKIANETMLNKIHNLQQSMSEQSTTIDNYRLQIEKARQDIKHKLQEINDQENLRIAAEEQVSSLKIQVQHHKQMVQFSDEHAGDSQLEALRSMTICSVCSKNWKNCVIKVCGHVFCMDCAKDRLNARLRKCPACNKQYSHSDIMAIHL